MPSYGRGMSYLPDMGGGQEQNPYYDPYSPKPNYFRGIAATLENYMLAKQAQEDRQMKMEEARRQQEQQALENELRRAQIEKTMRPVVPDEPEFMKQARAYATEKGITLGEAVELFAPKRTTPAPPDTLDDIREKARARAEGTAAGKPPVVKATSPEAATKGDAALLSKVVNKYDAVLSALEGDISKAESDMVTARGADKPNLASFKAEKGKTLASQRDSLAQIKAYLATIGEQLGSGRPLTGKQRARLSALLASVDAAKTSPSLLTDIGGTGTVTDTVSPVADDIESDPEFQAFVRAHPQEPRNKVRDAFKNYRASQKR